MGIAVDALLAFEPFHLPVPRIVHAGSNVFRRLSRFFRRQFFKFHCRDFNVDVYTVEKRAGDLRHVLSDLLLTAVALVNRRPEESARTPLRCLFAGPD